MKYTQAQRINNHACYLSRQPMSTVKRYKRMLYVSAAINLVLVAVIWFFIHKLYL